MNDYDATVFKKILEPGYDFSKWDVATFEGIGMEAVTIKSLHQRLLGKLAMGLQTKYGEKTIPNFAKEIGVAPQTLYQYKEIEERTGELDIPEDFSWSVRYWMAFTPDPKGWLKKALDNGWSASQLIREIKLTKVSKKEKKVCPVCGQVIREKK